MTIKKIVILVLLLIGGATRLNSQVLSVSTNVLSMADYGTMNLSASYAFARHWSAFSELKYNPFTFLNGEEKVMKKERSISAGARYWPWHIYSGWWMSGALRLQEYNTGGISSPQTYEGSRLGGTVSAGYSFMLNPHFNIDLGLGLWTGYDRYTLYNCQTCGRVLDRGEKFFVLPSDFVLSLAYIF